MSWKILGKFPRNDKASIAQSQPRSQPYLGDQPQQNYIMSEQKGLSNNQIADIYDNMLNGDKNALFRLQKISTKQYMPKYLESYYNKKYKNSQNELNDIDTNPITMSQSKVEQKEFKEVSSVPSMPLGKDHLFLNILKKGAKMDGTNNVQKQRVRSRNFKRVVNSSNRAYQPNDKAQVTRQKKTNNEIKESIKESINNNIDLKVSLDQVSNKPNSYALPKLHKAKESADIAKAQSTYIEPANKNAALEGLEKSKIAIKKERVDFRDIINHNKKLRQEFDKKNAQEKEIQLQIMQYHNETKDYLEKMKEKYGLNLNNKNKYLKKKTKIVNEVNQSGEIKQTNSQKKISSFKLAMMNEGQKCTEIEAELAHLKSLFNKNNHMVKKLQKEKEEYKFVKYLERYGHEIQQEVQEEEDTVEPLQVDESDKNQYKYLMAKTRQKKWSLVQRTQYETQRASSLGQSRKANTTSRATEQTQLRHFDSQQNANKVTVNQRLKNLLFS